MKRNKYIHILIFLGVFGSWFLTFPLRIFAANYGDGNYGGGNYGEGVIAASSNSNTNQSSNSGGSGSSTGTPICGDAAPAAPKLFQIDVKGTSAKIFFTPLPTTNKFYVSFSTKTNAEENGVEVTLAKEGVQNFTVNSLKPNTTYYFKVRGQNGCMPGPWSGIVKATSSRVGVKQNVSYYLGNVSTKIAAIWTAVNPIKTKTVIGKIGSKKEVTQEPAPVVTQSETVKSEVTLSPAKSAPKKTCILWWCF